MSDTSGVGDYQNPVKFDFAVPANLTGGARLIHGANRGLMPASALEALYEHFCASCQYGSLTVGACLASTSGGWASTTLMWRGWRQWAVHLLPLAAPDR